jgi:hypothetical protein
VDWTLGTRGCNACIVVFLRMSITWRGWRIRIGRWRGPPCLSLPSVRSLGLGFVRISTFMPGLDCPRIPGRYFRHLGLRTIIIRWDCALISWTGQHGRPIWDESRIWTRNVEIGIQLFDGWHQLVPVIARHHPILRLDVTSVLGHVDCIHSGGILMLNRPP